MAGSAHDHKHKAGGQGPIPVMLVTVSDTRTPETDENGKYLSEQITTAGHNVISREIVKDEPQAIADVLEKAVQSDARIVIFNGGTGISHRDRTFDVISRCLDKELPGFGELFRVLSYEQVGASAMLSRAVAGVYHDTIIMSLPGSPMAVQLAWEKLIASEMEHLAWELIR
ncbi:MAG: molybdenum cofactor biosynthesis protein MoaB [Candidatus Omnitrophica bacterium]|nr:molybdenum cofactor biosynthesis protein MoaB [Candidatus Omnitrophota bacterium]